MKNPLYLLALLCIISTAKSQELKTFSRPIETRAIDFFIIGRLNNKVLVYNSDFRTERKDKYQLYLYDQNMQLVKQVILPLPHEAFGMCFLTYEKFVYVFYQHQSGRTVSLMAMKIDGEGNIVGAPKELDNTPKLDFWAKNKIYSIVASENKKYITAFKVNNAEGPNTTVTTVLLNDTLGVLHKSVLNAPIVDGVEFFSEFAVDNEGNFVFMRNVELDEIPEVAKSTGMVVKQAMSDSVWFVRLLPEDVNANDIRIKIDNLNHRYIAYALYTSNAQRDIDGLYCFVMDAATKEPLYSRKTIFEKEIRQQLEQAGTLKTAFNHCFLQSMHLRVDGGFVIDANSYYSMTNDNVRWRKFFNGTQKLPCGYLVYDPFAFNVADPGASWQRYPSGSAIGNSKIVAFSFDATANPEWIKMIHASQNVDFFAIGYISPRINDKLYYIHNETARNSSFLTAQMIDRSGEVSGDLMFKDLEKTVENKMEFLTRLSLQVSNKEVIMPCRKGRYICFAKIEF